MGEGKDSEMASPELIQRYQNEDDVRDLIDWHASSKTLPATPASMPVAW